LLFDPPIAQILESALFIRVRAAADKDKGLGLHYTQIGEQDIAFIGLFECPPPGNYQKTIPVSKVGLAKDPEMIAIGADFPKNAFSKLKALHTYLASLKP